MTSSRTATSSGTEGYAARFSGLVDPRHFRDALGLKLSSIGIGTYLGDPDERTDEMYSAAVMEAVRSGVNCIDTAANYRFQRSERSIGRALERLFAGEGYGRHELVISTKGGYIPFDGHPPRSRQELVEYIESTFIRPGVCAPGDFVQGSHCMAPGYIEHQLARSLGNLGLDAVDIYYLHNPESQLSEVPRDEFDRRLRAAFETLEAAVATGQTAFYGAATWNGFRVPSDSPEHLSLEKFVAAAREVAGESHHFRVVQLPVNLAMIESFTHQTQILDGAKCTLLEAAEQLEVTVVASASVLQSRLTHGLPPLLDEVFPGLRTDAQRAIQFARSTPGVTTALVGMRSVEHVRENLEIAKHPSAQARDFMQLFSEP